MLRYVCTGQGKPVRAVEAIRRKLRGLAAVLHDPAATDHERVNAEALKARLEKKLRQEGVPAGDWTDSVFRLGRTVQEIKRSTSPPSSMSGSTKVVFRLGRVLRQCLKKQGPT